MAFNRTESDAAVSSADVTATAAELNILDGVTATAADINMLASSYTSYSPTVKFGSANTGITYSVQNGTYFQVGHLVFCTFYVRLSSKGTATGSIKISLPKPVAGNMGNTTLEYSGVVSKYSNMSFSDKTIRLVAVDHSNELQLYTGAGTAVLDTNCTDTTYFHGSITYLTD